MTIIDIKKDPCRAREAEKYDHPIPSREFIIQHLEELGRPATYGHFLRVFNLKFPEEQEALKRRLNAMLRDGQLISNRRGSFALAKQMELVRGRIITHKEGYGFLLPDDGAEKIFLAPKEVRSAFHGDMALVSIASVDKHGRRNGILVEILVRSTKQIVGRFIEENGVSYVISANKNIIHDVLIPAGKNGKAHSGQIVVADILCYPSKNRQAVGEIIEVLGEHMAPGMEIEIAIRSHNLPYKWSEAVLKESETFAKTISPKDKENRQNLQKLPFVTIDGEDAKDFDDAVYCNPNSSGDFQLYVAIADVSHYVRSDTSLDQEAIARGNSVYFPRQVIPMLPEILSNELCSLKPNVERLCLVCEMNISNKGLIKNYKFYEAVISSHARLTYRQVAAMLDGIDHKQPALLPHLRNLYNVYVELRKERHKRGALDFEMPETRIIFGKGRKIDKIIPAEHNYAHEIIEECMLAANVCTSTFLLQSKLPVLYRVNAGPDNEKIENLTNFLKGLGLKLGSKKPEPKDYAKLLKQIKGRPDEHMIQIVLLRSLQQAVYAPENIGHFGLAYKAYTHFTSPIRRYPDLLNHRAIRYLIHNRKTDAYTYDLNTVQNFGEHCSMTERRADEATRDVTDWLKCEYMLDKVGKTFNGIISGVMNFGLFVELKEVYVEGLLHITSLKNDYYKFDPIRHRLAGKRSGVKYRLGDPIRVTVTRVDLDEREIDFALEEKK